MTLDIEVALIADPTNPFAPGPIDADYFAQPYSERPKVAIEVDGDESLAATLERAAAEMGLRPPSDSWMGPNFDATHRKVAFYRPEHEDSPVEHPRGRLMMGELTLVDREGKAIFGVSNLRTVRYRDLLRAAAAGTIDGDPLRPYLIIDDGWGDAPPADWATLFQGLEVAWEVAKVFAVATGVVTGAVGIKLWVAERIRSGREALEANPEWAQRGYRPDQFITLLSTGEWTAKEAAPVLGCTEQDAEGVLSILGFARGDDGRWRRGADEAAVMVSEIADAVSYAAHAGGDWQGRLKPWLVRYLEDGEPPPHQMMDPPLPDG